MKNNKKPVTFCLHPIYMAGENYRSITKGKSETKQKGQKGPHVFGII